MDCKGQIDTHDPPDLGRLHTQLDAAILGDLELDADHPFVSYMADTVRGRLRLAWLTWSSNRAQS